MSLRLTPRISGYAAPAPLLRNSSMYVSQAPIVRTRSFYSNQTQLVSPTITTASTRVMPPPRRAASMLEFPVTSEMILNKHFDMSGLLEERQFVFTAEKSSDPVYTKKQAQHSVHQEPISPGTKAGAKKTAAKTGRKPKSKGCCK